MITHLEMILAEVIRRRSTTEEWMSLLSRGRQGKVREQMGLAEAHDTFVDPLPYTRFGDKVSVLYKMRRRSENPAGDPAGFKKDMHDIQNLRDLVAHANDYAATREAAHWVCRCVRTMGSWIAGLAGSAEQPREDGSDL
jgi:hypothetical protein